MLDSESFGEAAVGLSVYAVSMGDTAGQSAGNADAYRSSLVLRIVRCDPVQSTLRVMGSSCSVISRFV
jgi:hypothetical protein